MNRFLLNCVTLFVGATAIGPIHSRLLELLPTTSEPELPLQAAYTSLASSLLGFMPWLAAAAAAMFVVGLVFAESSFATYEPLTEGTHGDREIEALRRVLRRVREWLARQQLPAITGLTGPLTESISSLCEKIDRQLAGRETAELATTAASLHKLLTIELSTLVLRYRRLPNAHRLLPSLITSANDMLLNGLRAVDDQLRHVHENLVRSDIRDLAVQARYLELKSESEPRSAAVAPPRSSSRAHVDPLPCGAVPGFGALATPSQHRQGERPPEPDFTLMALGIAAVAASAFEGARAGSECEHSDGHYTGGGGAFGGGGASGDWVPDSDRESGTEWLDADNELSNAGTGSAASEPAPDEPDLSA